MKETQPAFGMMASHSSQPSAVLQSPAPPLPGAAQAPPRGLHPRAPAFRQSVVHVRVNLSRRHQAASWGWVPALPQTGSVTGDVDKGRDRPCLRRAGPQTQAYLLLFSMHSGQESRGPTAAQAPEAFSCTAGQRPQGWSGHGECLKTAVDRAHLGLIQRE